MFITYLLIRFVTLPLGYLPYKMIHRLGSLLGGIAYHSIAKYRKRALSNLALATDLHLTNRQIKQIAKESIQNLMITALEYPKLSREKEIGRIAHCANPEEADSLMSRGKGLIFFCGHQANWELLFLEGTSRMAGTAIGRPIKNRYLYHWIKQIREQFGGEIIAPKMGIKEGLRSLKLGKFLGIVGDQGMPNSGYFAPFLGRQAWSSPVPAMLSYKTATPIIVATTRREKGTYTIEYSTPLFPNLETSMEEEVERLMQGSFALLESSIKERPAQWLWIHNRWKQQPAGALYPPFRQDSLALFLPDREELLHDLPQIRLLYPTEHISIFIPSHLIIKISPINAQIYPYDNLSTLLREDFRFKLILNFTPHRKIERHYKRLAALYTFHFTSFQELIKRAKRA